MPRVYLTKQDELNSRLVALIYGTMKVKHVSQARIAKRLGISQPAFSKKLRKGQFTYWELVNVFDELGLDDEQILSVMRERRGA